MKKYGCIIKSLLVIMAILINSSLKSVNTYLLLILFFIGLKFYKNDLQKTNLFVKLLSILLSIFMIVGRSYELKGSGYLIYSNLIVTLISLVGYYLFFKLIINVIISNLDKFLNFKDKREFKRFNKHPFLFSFLIILICWSIYIIAFYPGILSPDPSNQILQFFNVDTQYIECVNLIDPSVKITNHHPVLHTVLLGGCTKIGHILGNDNLGIFIYTLMQVLILATVLAYTIKYLHKLKVPNTYLILLLLVYALVPQFPFYSMSLVKDTIYTALIILYVMFLFDTLYINNKLSVKRMIFATLLMILISLFRNNGSYIVLFTMPLLILKNSAFRKKLGIIFTIFIIFTLAFSKIILPYFKITPGSIREALSIPFQQTARYVSNYDVSLKDKKVIDKILTYDTLKERYNPKLSDKVKNEFNKDATKEDLIEYFKVWGKYLFKHPNIYVGSFIHNTYGYFYPNTSNWYIYHKFDSRTTKILDYHYNKLSNLRKVLSTYGKVFPFIPVIGLISNIGFNTWLVLLFAVICTVKNKRKFLIVLSPAFISILICFASPANTYFRYAMPYVFAAPFTLFLLYYALKD